MIPLIVIGVIALIVLFNYVSHHSLPSRQSPRERLLRLNPMLSSLDIRWPDPRPIVTLGQRIRRQLSLVTISMTLAASVSADRRGDVYVPAWYDR